MTKLRIPAHVRRKRGADAEAGGGSRQLKLGGVEIDVDFVPVGSARTEMPGLIRASAESGRAFLIRNARNPSAATALLVNPAVLARKLAAARPPRTLGDVIDALPFKRRGAPRLTVELPDDEAPDLRVPRRRRVRVVAAGA